MAKHNNIHPTRIFKTSDELKNAWDGFKENLIEQASEWLKIHFAGKDGDRHEEPQKVPMTLEGFKRYCWEHHGDVSNYFDNSDGYYDDFKVICSRIRQEIRENQIIGGLLGFYNPSITQRLNGLKETIDSTVTNNIQVLTIDPLSDASTNNSVKKDSEP